MKKIQVSTVQRTADVEVIYVNSPLVIKVARAQCSLASIKAKIESICMNPDKEVDSDGNVHEVLSYNGNGVSLSAKETCDLREDVIALIDELTSAFEGE